MASEPYQAPSDFGDEMPTGWSGDGLPFSGMLVAVPVPPQAYGTGSLAGIGPDGFADGGPLEVMPPGPLLEMLTEQVVTGASSFNWAPVTSLDRGEAGAEAASRAVGDGPLAGIPGVAGAAGVRDLTANELLGTVSAARRLADRAGWMMLALASELVRRRLAEAEVEAPQSDHRPPGQPPSAGRPGRHQPAEQRRRPKAGSAQTSPAATAKRTARRSSAGSARTCPAATASRAAG